MIEERWIQRYRTIKIWMLLKRPACHKLNMITIQGSGESGDKVQENETITKHKVTCTMIVDTKLQKKPHPCY